MTEGAETPAEAGFSLPAEWALHARSWMAWPCRAATWHGGIEAAREAHVQVAKALAQFEKVTLVCNPDDMAEASLMCGSGVELVPIPMSDGWMRDTGPAFVTKPDGATAGVDWTFNGWGGLHNEFAADADIAAAVLAQKHYRRFATPLVLEGGAIGCDGEGTLLVTEQCLLDPRRNPGASKADMERTLHSMLGISNVIWLGQGYDGDETKGHVDNIACFIEPGTVLLQMPRDTADPNYAIQQDNVERLKAARDAAGRKLEIILAPQPAARERDGRRLVLSYINFAFANGGLVIPSFGDPCDDQAYKLFTNLFPGRRIIQILSDGLVIGGAGIHCITLQEPAAPSRGEQMGEDTA